MPPAAGCRPPLHKEKEAIAASDVAAPKASLGADCINNLAFSTCHPAALRLIMVDVEPPAKDGRPWLRTDWECGRIFAEKYGPYLETKRATYVTMPLDAERALAEVTNELQKRFLEASAYVLEGGLGDAAATMFGIPSFLWPRVQASWRRSGRDGSDLLVARYDVTLTAQGPKCYEYNCDSASCLFECAVTQDAYAQAVGADAGRSAGHDVHDRLVETWRRLGIVGPLHIMCDDVDVEERYHAQYMKAAAEEAGIACRLVVGDPALALAWAADGSGDVQDAEGCPVRTVWKTWSWRTAVTQLQVARQQDRNGEVGVASCRAPPSLADVLFHPRIQTFEPLWTLVPSSKAILPILWRLFPHHPCLLKADFCITDRLHRSGYAIKPINGRGGADVQLVSGRREQELEEQEQEAGAASDEKTQHKVKLRGSVVYQELCPLPRYGPMRVQLSPWVVGGSYAGTVLRFDEKDVLDLDSPVCPLRVVEGEGDSRRGSRVIDES
jgi:glutathionylspermidine amidase/synthetase